MYMEMVYQDNTLFVDLSGDVDIESVRSRIFNVVSQYKINNVVVSVGEVFNYRRGLFNDLKNDYSRVYGGNIVIRK